MNKKIFLVFTFIFLFLPNYVFAETNASSRVTGEIVSGEFSMSTPNNLTFIAKINGKTQVVDLETINVIVTDYRGVNSGWNLTVKSPNYSSYSDNYHIKINKKEISQQSESVYLNKNQDFITELQLPTSIEIEKNAKPGSYGADLEWNLQPDIKNIIEE